MAQVGRLSVFLASVSLLPWMVLFAESPEPPKLVLHPQYPIYIQGEEVTLGCSAPAQKDWMIEYTFWVENGDQVVLRQFKTTSSVFKVDGTSVGWFYCVYRIQLVGGEIQSSRSNPVNVTRTESPLPPKLSLQPQHPVYILGEGVTLTCSAPAGLPLTKYTFYQQSGGQALELLSTNAGNMFRLDGNAAGSYGCVYWTWVSGREIPSLRSNSIPVARTEPPQQPTLLLLPQHPIYIQGERITLICSAPTQTGLSTYTFWEERGGQRFVRQAKTHSSIFVDQTSAGWFYCIHCIWASGREIESSRSNSIKVVRTARPRAPTLSLQPQHPIYIQGEAVTLICSAPPWTEVTGYTFWEERGSQDLQLQPETPNSTFTLDGMSTKLFNCIYWIWVSGREVQSSMSNSINVARTDPLQPPELVIDPPSGEVNQGEPLLISCLANRSNREKRFHFYKDGVEMDSSNEGSISELGGPSPNATLRIPQANSSHSGGFACSFEENMSSRWISSPWSQKVNVQVHAPDSSLPALVSVCFALLVLILVVSLTCYYCWRKKASKGQEEFQPQRNQEETDNLGRLEPQATASQPQAEVRLNHLKPEEVSYSEIQFRPPHGLNSLSPAGEDGVTYSEIQVRPTHRAAK